MDEKTRSFATDRERIAWLGEVLRTMSDEVATLAGGLDTLEGEALRGALRRLVASSNAIRTASFNLTRAAGNLLTDEEEEA